MKRGSVIIIGISGQVTRARKRFLPTVCGLLVLGTAAAARPVQAPTTLDAARRQAIVSTVAKVIADRYVFADLGKQMGERLQTRLADGAYDSETDIAALADRLTQDIYSVKRDLHLRVHAYSQPRSGGGAVSPEQRSRQHLESLRSVNYGFERVEILQGNIGYLFFGGFVDTAIDGAAQAAVAAMNLLANCDALIVDLRKNGGGMPSMIQLLCSYFFDVPTHLNDFYIREGNTTRQFWTQAHVQGRRLSRVPIYVLVNGITYSAAEEFAYDLKNLGRATIVGETTRGGAHPVRSFEFPELSIALSVPYGRAVNPITGTNWEGTGVEPDIRVPSDKALDVACVEAIKRLLEQATDADAKRNYERLLQQYQTNPTRRGPDQPGVTTSPRSR